MGYKVSIIVITNVLMGILFWYWTLICTLNRIEFYYFYFVPYSYISHVLSLHTLYIKLRTVKYINCIIKCNIVSYSYFPHVLLLHILYIQLQTVKCIKSIINCNIVPYSYFPHVLLIYILCIQPQTLNILTVLLTVILSRIYISLMFC